uniref:Secreted protein n=1 Tax=Trichogramma kaykai TaxID=54128 RepID=A0ABD2W158_9HYME
MVASSFLLFVFFVRLHSLLYAFDSARVKKAPCAHGKRTRRARLAGQRIFAQNCGDLWLRSSAAHALRYVVHIQAAVIRITHVSARAGGLNSNAASYNCNSRHRTVINSSSSSSSSSREPCACRAAVHPPSHCTHVRFHAHSARTAALRIHNTVRVCARTPRAIYAQPFFLPPPPPPPFDSFFFLLGRALRAALRGKSSKNFYTSCPFFFSLSSITRYRDKCIAEMQVKIRLYITHAYAEIRGVKQETRQYVGPTRSVLRMYMGTRCLAEDEKGLKCTRNRTERRVGVDDDKEEQFYSTGVCEER